MWTDIGLIALGIVWLLVPVWLVSTVYVGWLAVGALERQAQAMEDISDSLQAMVSTGRGLGTGTD